MHHLPRCRRAYLILALTLLFTSRSSIDAGEPKIPKIAALVSTYYQSSHADVIVSRLLQTDTLDGRGGTFRMGLVSLFVDQLPADGKGRKDVSRELTAGRGVRLSPTVADALTLGTDKLAVDGVLLVFEHGDYPRSDIGSLMYPKRKHFEQIVEVFERSGRVAPVYLDKQLSDNWADAKAVYDAAQRLHIPMMAGSSIPTTWRYPQVDTRRDERLKQVVAISYGTLDSYGFHALEAVQCLVERRPGGERGVKAVQCLSGDAVWQAGEDGVYDPKLLTAALARREGQPRNPNLPLREQAKTPELFIIDYIDGPRACVLTLNGAVAQWAAAWRYEDGSEDSTAFWAQEARPHAHFTYLVRGIEQMMLTGKPTWPVERTLLTSGALTALLTSKKEGGRRLETPELRVAYQSSYDWRQPPPPPHDQRAK